MSLRNSNPFLSFVGNFLQVLAHNLDPAHTPVCNNATWALGEIALQMGGGLQPYINNFLPTLIQIMNTPKISQTLLENTGMLEE